MDDRTTAGPRRQVTGLTMAGERTRPPRTTGRGSARPTRRSAVRRDASARFGAGADAGEATDAWLDEIWAAVSLLGRDRGWQFI